jgi:hypothetical protein
MSHRGLLVGLTMLVASAGIADAGMRALVGGKRFTTGVKRGSYTGPFFVTGRSRQGAEPGTTRELHLACGPVAEQDTLPKTVTCVSSYYGVSDTASQASLSEWLDDDGTLHATVTSFVKLRSRYPKWRIRGSFSGTLAPFENAPAPLEITDGRFGAVLQSVGGGND